MTFLSLVPPDGVVLDVGANIGLMAIHLARRTKGRVIAIEPMPANIKALRRLIKYYKLNNIIVLECAVGNEEGEIEMVMPMVGDLRMQGLSHVIHDSVNTSNVGEKFKVPITRLDNIEEIKAATSIGAIKMDVENFEYFVLEGAKELLAKHRPILYIELWPNENRSRSFGLLAQLGYVPYVVDRNRIVRYTSQNKLNFIFIIEGIHKIN